MGSGMSIDFWETLCTSDLQPGYLKTGCLLTCGRLLSPSPWLRIDFVEWIRMTMGGWLGMTKEYKSNPGCASSPYAERVCEGADVSFTCD